jgi:signal peptidase I
MEGDSVHIDGEGLWRNQTIIADPDRFRTKSKGLALAVQLERYEYVVPKGHLILLGDNPLGSKDSLRYGLVSVKQVEGKVINIGDQPECSNTLELEPEYSRASAPIF